MKKIIFYFLIMLFYSGYAFSQQMDSFVFTQVKHNGYWDPYPDVYREILSFIVTTTSMRVASARRVVSFSSAEIFDSPFLVIAGSGDIGRLANVQAENLERFIRGGGIIFVDSSEAVMGAALVSSVKREFAKVFPDAVWDKIPQGHAVLRSFYLLRTVGGRRIASGNIQGMTVDGFASVIVSENDLLGAWARDPMGNHMYGCSPGGEAQRLEAIKLTANVILYALTGTYKTDSVHIPFILRKLKTKY